MAIAFPNELAHLDGRSSEAFRSDRPIEGNLDFNGASRPNRHRLRRRAIESDLVEIAFRRWACSPIWTAAVACDEQVTRR